MQNVSFVETGFTGETNFIVWYSVANSDLLSNSQFKFAR
jgi:hypothetical protein